MKLGYSVFVPATPDLESWRPQIVKEIEKLIKAFDIQFGQIHPEYFVTSDGTLYFGEVAYRPPGFKALSLLNELMVQRLSGVDSRLRPQNNRR